MDAAVSRRRGAIADGTPARAEQIPPSIDVACGCSCCKLTAAERSDRASETPTDSTRVHSCLDMLAFIIW